VGVSPAPAPPSPDAERRLKRVSRFIDTFCSSGWKNTTCSLIDSAAAQHRFQYGDRFGSGIECTYALQTTVPNDVPWLFQLSPLPVDTVQWLMGLPAKDWLPDIPQYYVHQQGAAASYGFFLPAAMFPNQVTTPTAQYDARRLQFVVQGDQYTIFRYQPDGAPSSIIKRARIDTSTLKYMLREKAMLGYLRHDSVVKLKRSFSPTLLLADVVCGQVGGNYHDTYAHAASRSVIL